MDNADRTYRRWIETDLRTFEVRIGESDLLISVERTGTGCAAVQRCPSPCGSAERALRLARAELEAYIARDPEFERTLRPRDALAGTPAIARRMIEAARGCDVGPMAAVAGAVAQVVGEALLAESRQVIVENGGDIFLYTARPRTAAIYAGGSPLSGTVGIKVGRLNEPLGLCTSSGTVGPSLSFGKADAAATALGNRVKTAADIEPALEAVSQTPGIYGLAAIIGDHLGAWGEMELVRLAAADM